jgi:hypothetical protein
MGVWECEEACFDSYTKNHQQLSIGQLTIKYSG